MTKLIKVKNNESTTGSRRVVSSSSSVGLSTDGGIASLRNRRLARDSSPDLRQGLLRLKNKPLADPYSVYPPQTYLTFGYWIYMVPQYKPKSVLILGYGGGTIAGLTKLIWGNVPITGVDIEAKQDRYGVNFIQADAREFVKSCANFDAVIVDLFYPGSDLPCEFVGDPDFIKDLERISRYLIINSLHSDMSAYNHLCRIGINKPSGSSEQIYYFEFRDKIPNLHPWK